MNTVYYFAVGRLELERVLPLSFKSRTHRLVYHIRTGYRYNTYYLLHTFCEQSVLGARVRPSVRSYCVLSLIIYTHFDYIIILLLFLHYAERKNQEKKEYDNNGNYHHCSIILRRQTRI